MIKFTKISVLAMQLFKKNIILFWSLWWLIASWTDIVGVLSHLSWLNTSWAKDTNYPFLVDSLKMYSPEAWVCPLLYTGIIFWSLLNAALFIYACTAFNKPRAVWLTRAEYAFTTSLCFWLAFFLADQIVMNYDLEQNHMVQGGFQLLTFLCLYLLPEK